MSSHVRTFRCPDALWERARTRADDYGISVSHAIRLMLEKLADGEGIGVVSRPEVTEDDIATARRLARELREHGFDLPSWASGAHYDDDGTARYVP